MVRQGQQPQKKPDPAAPKPEPLNLGPAESTADPDREFDFSHFPQTVEGLESLLREVRDVQNAMNRESTRRARALIDRSKKMRGYVVALQTRLNEKRKAQG